MPLDFLTPKYETVEINGTPVNFYPVSIVCAFNIKEAIKPFARAFASLLADTSGDRGYTSSKSADGFEQTVVKPMGVELAELRAKQRDAAVLDLVDSVTEVRSRTALGRLIMDSMRDEFPSRKHEQNDVNDFLEKVDTDTMIQLVKGVLKANARVFGPFGQKVAGAFKAMGGRLESLDLEPTTEEVDSSQMDIGTQSHSVSTSSSQGDTLTNES